jgi:hypothetical protein
MDSFEKIVAPLFGIIIACGGGVCDYLMSDKHDFRGMFISLFLAGFCGLLVYFIVKDIEYISESYSHVICGISGLSSKSLLKVFKKIGESKICSFIKG